MAAELSIVVLSWNQRDLTRRCLQSISSGTRADHEIIIVDNGSDDGSQEVASRFGQVIANPRNEGFARGMNQGLAAASGRFVVFANNDTVFPPSWDDAVLAHLAADAVGIAYPAVTRAGMPGTQRSQAGGNPVVVPAFTELLSGVVVAMRTETARSLGGWCEDYDTAGGEDFDLLFTVWANGLTVVIEPGTLIEHAGSATVGAAFDRHTLFKENRNAFLEKWIDQGNPSVPRLPWLSDDQWEANRERASIAAGWAKRWFETSDVLSAERRRIREMKAQLGARTGFLERAYRKLRR